MVETPELTRFYRPFSGKCRDPTVFVNQDRRLCQQLRRGQKGQGGEDDASQGWGFLSRMNKWGLTAAARFGPGRSSSAES